MKDLINFRVVNLFGKILIFQPFLPRSVIKPGQDENFFSKINSNAPAIRMLHKLKQNRLYWQNRFSFYSNFVKQNVKVINAH